MRTFISTSLALLLLLPTVAYAAEELPSRVYYRYINEQGNTVLNHSIPPQYVRKGYEVVSMSGEVLRVVNPAPSEEDAERIAREKAIITDQAEEDALLRRRYSNLNDIDAIKRRSLLELKSNIDILQGNLSSTRQQIERQQTQAAALERGGRTVPPETFKLISDLQTEEKDIQLQIKHRELEYQSQSDKFDQDRHRFTELLQEKNSEAAQN
jgi:hypothetical protein